MALDIPDTAETIIQRAKTDVRRSIPGSNPFLKNSVLGALITGYANRVFDFYLQLKEAIRQNFPDTATGTFLERWAAIFGLTRLAATKSSGNIIATGVDTSVIVSGTNYATSDGIVFTSNTTVAITTTVLSVSSIIRIGQTATVTTAIDHDLASNVGVLMSGADQSEYNIDTEIQVTGPDTFTYVVTGTPTTPATGTILVTHTSIPVPVDSEEFQDSENDINVNLDLDTPLNLQSPIIGVDTVANVDNSTIDGGADQETDALLRLRLLTQIQNPIANFNKAAIDAQAKLINGVTRVFIQEAGTATGTVSVTSITRVGFLVTVTTTTPHGLESNNLVTITGADQTDYNVVDANVLVQTSTVFVYFITTSPTTPATGTILATTALSFGQVEIFFMRDNDADPIPTGGEITDVKDSILLIKPANTIDDDVIVNAPTAVSTDYTFSALSPNTAAMQTAISANLVQFYSEDTEVGIDIFAEKYIAAIQNTVDESGNGVDSFALSAPSGDITIDPGEIGTLGTVTYP